MAKRMTVKEIDRFREKLEKTEVKDSYIQEQKDTVISCLKNICDQMEYRDMKSLRMKEN